MRKYFLLFILVNLISNNIGHAQSLDDLDKKRGFKIFTLGDDLQKFAANLGVGSAGDNENIYEYIDNNDPELYSLFNFKIDHIILGFDKNNRLVGIYLIKCYPYTSENYSNKDIIDDIELIQGFYLRLFGKWHDIPNKDEDGVYWGTEKTQLEVSIHWDKEAWERDAKVVGQKEDEIWIYFHNNTITDY